MNVQANQEIDTMESSLNKDLDGFKVNWIINLTTWSVQFQSVPVSNMFIKRGKIQKEGP